jgi:hypothetical protein
MGLEGDGAFPHQRLEVLVDGVGGGDAEDPRELRARRGATRLGEEGPDGLQDFGLSGGERGFHGHFRVG